jgi:hypothetical protein
LESGWTVLWVDPARDVETGENQSRIKGEVKSSRRGGLIHR